MREFEIRIGPLSLEVWIELPPESDMRFNSGVAFRVYSSVSERERIEQDLKKVTEPRNGATISEQMCPRCGEQMWSVEQGDMFVKQCPDCGKTL